jgi:septum formation protein
MAHPLVLASTSPYRAELLRRLCIGFEVAAPGVDESPQAGETPGARALRLARAKALAVAARYPGSWVIGSDQVADLEGRILGKPGDAERCRAQLAAESGRVVVFHTAAVLLRHGARTGHEHVDLTSVRFRSLTTEEIARYVERDRPFDCAGGFRSEGLGAALFESMETRDPAALVGLPLIWLAGALRSAGLDPLARTEGV